jgi:hypothetical protein
MGPLTSRLELDRATSRVRVAFGTVGSVAGIVAAVGSWAVRPSVPLALVVGIVTATAGRVAVDLASGRGQLRRGATHAVFPLALAAVFTVAAGVWGAGWLAASVSLAAALVVGEGARRALAPDVFIADEVEQRRELERRRIDQELGRSLGSKVVTAPSRPRLRV